MLPIRLTSRCCGASISSIASTMPRSARPVPSAMTSGSGIRRTRSSSAAAAGAMARTGSAPGPSPGHAGARQAEAVFQRGLQVQAGADAVVQPDMDQPLGHRPADQPLRPLAADPQLGGDLVLRQPADIIQPAGAGGFVCRVGFGSWVIGLIRSGPSVRAQSGRIRRSDKPRVRPGRRALPGCPGQCGCRR
jgi:hypothetical protein